VRIASRVPLQSFSPGTNTAVTANMKRTHFYNVRISTAADRNEIVHIISKNK